MSSVPLPEELILSLQGVPGFDETTFRQVHETGEQVSSIRFNPSKLNAEVQDIFPGATKIPWSSYGYYLRSRPSFTLDPLIHAGAYYVQEASGMFLEVCIRELCDLSKPLKVLDLCAAPGGKSTLIQSIISKDSLLVSNEVIKPRANILAENLAKWGGENTIVTNNDPRDFSRLNNFFDLIMVDAPCSGSGLFRKDPEAITEWSEQLVVTCSQRQRRILHDVLSSLKPGGILIYSTCSYSVEEDEDICDWLIEEENLTPVSLDIPSEWNITLTYSRKSHSPGFRFFPDKLKGEGFYIACFQKNGEEEESPANYKNKLSKITSKELNIVQPFLQNPGNFQFYHLEAGVFAFPSVLEQELISVTASLYVKKAGVLCGKLVHQTLVPDHELALSTIINDKIPALLLEKEPALQYLRKEEVKVETDYLGWALVRYKGFSLGWVKILNNRINNYYPKEWRILKTGNS